MKGPIINLRDFKDSFNQKWGIASQKNELPQFKNRVLNIFKKIDEDIIPEGQLIFCQFYGIPDNSAVTYGGIYYSTNIIKRLNEENDEVEFFRLIAFILNLPFKPYYPLAVFDKRKDFRIEYYMAVKNAIQLSELPIALEVAKNGQILIIPFVEEMLHEELVLPALSFLNDKSNKHFVEALEALAEKKYISSATSLRRASEEFLRFKLNNDKGLEANLEETGRILKSNKSEQTIRNIIQIVFKYLDKYFNDNEKHGDGDLTEYETHYLVYQVASLMYYVNKSISKS